MSGDLTQQQRSTGGGGCLRSCLIASAIVLVLVAGGLFATYTFGRRYVSRNLPQWQTQYPLLGWAVTLLDLRESFQDTVPQVVGGSGRVEGEVDKALLPDDLALHPHPASEVYSIGSDHVTGFQRVEEAREPVAAALRNGMDEWGWELVSLLEDEATELQVWRKGERVCQIEVVAGDQTEVWLRCRTARVSPEE